MEPMPDDVYLAKGAYTFGTTNIPHKTTIFGQFRVSHAKGHNFHVPVYWPLAPYTSGRYMSKPCIPAEGVS